MMSDICKLERSGLHKHKWQFRCAVATVVPAWLMVVVLVFLMMSASAQTRTPAGPGTQSSSFAGQTTTNTLVVGSEQDFPPFATGLTDATAGGFTVDLWRAVATEMGLNYTLRVKPFHQLLQEFKDGKIDVMINLAVSRERQQFADFSVPHVTVHGAIFVRKGHASIQSENDLEGRSIIVLNADLAHDYAIAKGWEQQLVLVETAAEGLELLASGQHDVMLLSKLTGLQTLQALALTNIEALPVKPGFSQKFAFATQHLQTELLAQLNEGLALSKANGVYNKLYEKWFGIYEIHEVGLHDILIYLVPVVALFTFWMGYVFYRRHVERVLTNAAIAASRDLLMAIIDTAPVRVFWKDRELRYLGCNSAFARDAGLTSPQDLIGKDDYQLGWADQAELYRADDRAVMASGTAKLFFVEPKTTPGGQKIWLRSSKIPLKNKKNEIFGIVGIYEDFTERKQAEDQLKASEAFKNVILNSMDAEIVVLDHEGVILAVNEPWRRFAQENSSHSGKPNSSVEIGTNYLTVCEAAVGQEASEALLISTSIRAVLGGQSASFSLEYPCHSPQQMRWFKMLVLPLGQGANTGVVITHTNITDRVQLEQERAAALSHLQKIASRVPGLVYQYRLRPDGSSCFPYASEVIREIYQVSPEEVREDASKVVAKLHSDDRQAVLSSIQKSAQDLSAWQQDYRVRHEDGSVRWLFGNAVPERDSDGSILWHGFITDITERRQAEETLRKLSIAVEQSPASIVITNLEAKIEYVNPQFTKVSGYSAAEAIGKNPRILQSRQTPDETYRQLWDRLTSGQAWHGELINRRKNGELYWEESHIAPVKSESGQITHYVAIKIDVTERIRSAEKIEALMRQLKTIVNNDLIGIATVKERKIIWANPAYEKMFGYTSGELAGVATRQTFLSDEAYLAFGAEAYPLLGVGQVFRTQCELVRKDGQPIWADVSGQMLDPATGESLWSFIDMTQQKRMEDKVRQLAFHDALTNLPNRRLFLDRLGQAMAVSKRTGRYLAVMFLDIDNFKPLNDAQGHKVGDLLLMDVAERLTKCVREIDTVARFGGDEFVVMLGALQADLDTSLAQVQIIAEKIRLALSEPYQLSVSHVGLPAVTVTHRCSASIGVAVFDGHEGDEESVLKWADTAMYQAKEAGRNRVRFYEEKNQL